MIADRFLRTLLAFFFGAVLAASPAAAQEGDPDFFTLMLGAFDFDDEEQSAEGHVQFRLNNKLWIFKPQIGMMFNSDKGFFGYAGVLVDTYWGRRIVLTPSFAVGGYSEGDSKDLGGPVEFRSAIELAYRFDDHSRIGIQLSHISNAGIHEDNPGTNSLLLTYLIPTDVFSR